MEVESEKNVTDSKDEVADEMEVTFSILHRPIQIDFSFEFSSARAAAGWKRAGNDISTS